MLLGREAVERLEQATVAVFGLGGVGSYTAEALARAGVGRLILVDGDTGRIPTATASSSPSAPRWGSPKPR